MILRELVGDLRRCDDLRAVLAGRLAASYHIEIEDRCFEFGVARVSLTAAKESPAVTVTTTAAELITARLAPWPPSAR